MPEVLDWGLASWSWFGYGHWSMIHPCSKFWLSIFILRVQRTFMSPMTLFGAFEDTAGSWLGFWHLDINLDMFTCLWYTHDQNFGSLPCFWWCIEHPFPLSPHLELWRMLEFPYWVFASGYLFGYSQWSLIHLCFESGLSILILREKVTSMSFMYWFGALEEAGRSWLGFGTLVMIWI